MAGVHYSFQFDLEIYTTKDRVEGLVMKVRYKVTESDRRAVRQVIINGGIKALMQIGNECLKDVVFDELIKLGKKKCPVKSL